MQFFEPVDFRCSALEARYVHHMDVTEGRFHYQLLDVYHLHIARGIAFEDNNFSVRVKIQVENLIAKRV